MIIRTIRRPVALFALAVVAVLFAGCAPSPRSSAADAIAAPGATDETPRRHATSAPDAVDDEFTSTTAIPAPPELDLEAPSTSTTTSPPPAGPVPSISPELPISPELRADAPDATDAPDAAADPAPLDAPVAFDPAVLAAAPPATADAPPPAAGPPPSDASALAAFARSPAQTDERVVLDAGHVDLVEVTVDAGRLVVRVKDDTTGGGAVFRSPTDVQARVKDPARIQVPDDPAFAFLGAPGTDMWMLPQVQDPTLLWPGWSTERIQPGQLRGDSMTLRLAAADGPGPFALFTTDQFGVPKVLFDSDGPAPNSTVVPVRTHAHSNWAFGASGVYRLTFEVAGTLSDGSPVATPVTYVVLVGDATAPVPWDRTGDPATTAPMASPAAVPDARAAAGGASAPGPSSSPSGPGATGSGSGGTDATGARGRSGVTPAAPGAPAATLARTGTSPLLLGYVGVGLVVAGMGLVLRRGRRGAGPGRG